jgi:predicted oxidoreductase
VQTVLARLAAERGVSVATLAYAWVLGHPSRPLPITGSGRTEALQEAVKALDVPLDRQDWYEVWQAAMGHEVP